MTSPEGQGPAHSCTREQQLRDMIASGHVDAPTARAALRQLRDAHRRAAGALTLAEPGRDGDPG